jgi:NAD(P)-dependent dehydrogenase (short-subunit alcohol dehydrogenase family)
MAFPSVVVITGASAGVGRATAREFASRGADVGLLARDSDGLQAAAEEVEGLGRRAVVVPTDVADPDQVDAAADRVEAQLGPIDVWVNDAMTSVFAPFTEIEPAEFRRVTEVTYLGFVNGTRAALRRMQPRDRGTIIQVGSALAYRGIPLQSAYCGGKHAIKGFTESVRTELLHEKSAVRLTMVQMPALNTPQFEWVLSRLPRSPRPVAPIYQPEVAGRAIVWAATHRRRQVWVGASTVATIVGNRVVPGLLDRYLARTGYDAQQTSQPAGPGRPSNLWAPVPGDHGAHGPFDNRAHKGSPELWASIHRGSVAAALAGIGGVAALASVRSMRSIRSIRSMRKARR